MAERRNVLKVLAGCATTAAAGVSIVPALGLIAESARGGDASENDWVRVARLEALRTGSPEKFAVVGTEVDAWSRAPDRRIGAVFLVREGDASVRAYSAICPHLGCSINHVRDRFECPCHESAFDLHGNRIFGPSLRGMDPLQTRVTDGWVHVRFRRFRTGVSERIPV